MNRVGLKEKQQSYEKNTSSQRRRATIKILVGVMFIFFLTGTASAMDWDNGLLYDEDDLKVTITNKDFWGIGDILGIDEKLGELTLTSHSSPTEIRNVIAGKNRAVMYYDFIGWELYENGLGEVYFTDMKTGLKIEKDYYFAEAIYHDVEVPTYKEVCKVVINKNNSKEYKSCSKEISGSKIESQFKEWKKLGTNDIPEKNVRIALIIDVNRNEYVDAIWTIAGKKVSRHASWQDSYDNGLYSYFDCEDEENQFFSPHHNLNDDTASFYINTNSKAGFGKYCNFSKSNKLTVLNTANDTNIFTFKPSTEGTVCFWARPSDITDTSYAVSKSGLYTIVQLGSTYWRAGTTFFASINFGGDDAPISKVWQFVCVRRDATNNDIFVNGTLDATQSRGAINYDSKVVSIGGNWDDNSYDGGIDEIAFWNRSLSNAEISALYDSGTGTPRIEEAENPQINITYPINNSEDTNVTLYVEYVRSNDAGIDSCWYSNGTYQVNKTLASCGNITGLTWPEGIHNVTIWINDSVGNLNWSSVIWTTIIPPELEIVYPINNSNHSVNTVDVNYSVSDLSLDSCWWSNNSGKENNSLMCGQNITDPIWYDGIHNITIWANDSLNNLAVDRITFNVDTTAPELNITYPTNGSSIIINSFPYNISVNYTIIETNLDSCWYSNNSGKDNTTLTCGENITASWIEGINNITIWANDNVGNENSTQITFYTNYLTTNVTYPNPVLEGSNNEIILNITATKITSLQGNFSYNGTSYNSVASFTLINGTLTNSVTAPTVTAPSTIYFFWNYSINGIDYNTAIYNHTINLVNLTIAVSCPTGLSSAMCWDFKLEQNLSETNGSINYNFGVGSTNSTYKTIYGSLDNVEEFCVCINSTIDNNYSLGSGEIQYSKTGYADRRFYTFDTQRLSNITINNTLYFLENGDATSFLFGFKDTSLIPYVAKYSSLLRWYPDLNEYIIVEMAKTDDKGETIMRVKTEDVDYRVGLYNQDGTLIKLLSPVRFACLSSPCSYNTLIEETPSDYTSFYDVETSIVYNTTSEIWTFVWNDPTQNTESMRFLVKRERGDSAFTICDDSASGFTGVLTCDSSGYTGTLRGLAYRTASPELPIAQKIINTGATIFAGSIGLLLSLIIFLVLAFIGAFSPAVAIILGVAGLFPAYLFGSISLTIFIAIGVLGGIVIHFMKRTG